MEVNWDRLKPGYKRREAARQLQARITALERWHRIFNEWATDGSHYPEAVEMANQGLTFMAWVLKNYYLPAVLEMLNTRTILEV